MTNKLLILCTSLLLSSSLSFASTTKTELTDNDGKIQTTSTKTRPFQMSDLENLFKERLEQAVHTQKTSGNHLSFLFRDNLQESIQKTYNSHKRSLEILKKEGFFENLYSLWTQQKLFAKNISETLGMQDLSSFQEVVKGNRHRIHLHQKTGLILRLKPAEQQFSLSFYTRQHQETLQNGTDDELRNLFSSLKSAAEAFKLYLYPKSKNNILAIPVPRDPNAAVSLRSFVGEENFENIPAHMMGDLSAYLSTKLIGTLGHIAYHALPTYMTIESSTQVKNIDFSSEEDFPSLGKPKAETEVTPKNSDISAFETTASTSSTITTTSTTSAYNEFDFNDADAYIPNSSMCSEEYPSSNDKNSASENSHMTTSTTSAYSEFDFNDADAYIPNSSMSSEEYPSSDNESTGTEYDHPAMPVYAYPVMIVGYDPYGYPIIVEHGPHHVPPYAYPFLPYPTAYYQDFRR